MNVLQNLDAEVALIGTAFHSRECAVKLAELPGDIFSQPETQAAHKAIQRALSKGAAVELISLCMEADKECSTASAMLIKANVDGIMTSMWGQWLAILDDCRQRRKVFTAAHEAQKAIQDPGESPEAVAGRLAAGAKVAETAQTSVGMVEAMAGLMETFGTKRKACQTGIADLDRLTGGFRGGKLVVLGARPGIGKTALALSIAKHVAEHTGGVLVVSLEMDATEIMARIYASESGVDVQELESGNLSDESLEGLARYAPLVTKLPIRIAEKASTPMQIRREASKMADSMGLAMIVVDYIQLMRPDNKHSSRYEEVSEISRELKLLAMDMGVPVLALTQFNRSSEAGKNGQASKRPPTMAEAKDSGSIEQDANVFIIQYAPDDPGNDPFSQHAAQVCEAYKWQLQTLTVEKNRQGRTGKIAVGFDRAHMRFHNFDFSGVIR